MKRLLLGMLLLAMIVVPAMAETDSEEMTMSIALYCYVSINEFDGTYWTTGIGYDELSVGKNTHMGIPEGHLIYLFGYDDRFNPAHQATVGIDINAPATAKAEVTGGVLTGSGTATGRTLLAGALIGCGTEADDFVGCVGEVGDGVAYPLELDYTRTQPGYNGPGLAVEVIRSKWDRAGDYTGTVVVTVSFD